MNYDALSNEDFKTLLRIVEAAVSSVSSSFLASLTASFSRAPTVEEKHKKVIDSLALFFAEKMGRSLSQAEQKSIEPILEQIFEMLERCIKDTKDTYTLMLDAQFSRLLEMQIATA